MINSRVIISHFPYYSQLPFPVAIGGFLELHVVKTAVQIQNGWEFALNAEQFPGADMQKALTEMKKPIGIN